MEKKPDHHASLMFSGLPRSVEATLGLVAAVAGAISVIGALGRGGEAGDAVLSGVLALAGLGVALHAALGRRAAAKPPAERQATPGQDPTSRRR